MAERLRRSEIRLPGFRDRKQIVLEAVAVVLRADELLPRARLLVLAGSIMGGDITRAANELRAVGIPVIALNMVGSITEAVDLVVSDPVQTGTMAVMAIADTATFDLARMRGRRL